MTFKPFLIIPLYIVYIVAVLAVPGSLGALWYVWHNHTIDFSVLEHYHRGKPSIVLDKDGKEWTRFQLDKRDPVSIDKIPQHLINAFTATEDWSFFKHTGLSCKGIIRSIIYNIYYGKKVQGASTITQQLVRLLFFDAKKTFSRKIKEQIYALLVERQFTKSQILEAYLNHVYFGCGIYGVEAASQRFWKKSVSDLSIDEAATLAGIVRSPGNYCPLLYPHSAQKRRNVVLHSMKKLGYLNDDEYQAARAVDLVLVEYDAHCCAPHLRETLRQYLEDMVGKEQLYSGGLVIQTTLDAVVQRCAEKAFRDQCVLLREELNPDVDGALLSVDTSSGEIRAMIGGFDFKLSKFNRALQAKRQIGSVFKPLVYAAALMVGKSFAHTYIDEPFELATKSNVVWRPNNFNNRFEGQITLARALTASNNIVTIKLLLEIGIHRVVDLAQRVHLDSVTIPYPSLALGCVDTTLKQATAMFNVFANHGIYVEPHYIKWIKNNLGEKIWRHRATSEYIMDARIADQVARVLMNGLGRARALLWRSKPWIDSEGFSKTGTTNDSRICWFAGATPSLTTVVYVGCDDNRSLGKHVYPSRTAFPIWINMHNKLASKQKKFSFDGRLKERSINARTGMYEDAAPGRETLAILE